MFWVNFPLCLLKKKSVSCYFCILKVAINNNLIHLHTCPFMFYSPASLLPRMKINKNLMETVSQSLQADGRPDVLVIINTTYKHSQRQVEPIENITQTHVSVKTHTHTHSFRFLLQITTVGHTRPEAAVSMAMACLVLSPCVGSRALWMNLVFRKSLVMTSPWLLKKKKQQQHVGFFAWAVSHSPLTQICHDDSCAL